MPPSVTGEHLTQVLHHEAPDGSAVEAIRVDYAPGGFTPGTHRHPSGAYVYVIDGSVLFGIDGRTPFLLQAGDSFYEQPDALHTVSRNASEDAPASLIAFFVLAKGQAALVQEQAA
jgi:quercetin dioxygenase-like cupin family protein